MHEGELEMMSFTIKRNKEQEQEDTLSLYLLCHSHTHTSKPPKNIPEKGQHIDGVKPRNIKSLIHIIKISMQYKKFQTELSKII